MDTVQLYGPIGHDLPLIEQTLEEVGKVEFPWLAALIQHVMSKTGKRLRPAMTLLAGRLYDYNLELLVPMAASVELLHTATLVHDDTLDRAARRRGILTVNHAWDDNVAVLFGDYLFAASGEMVSRTRNVRAMRLFAETVMVICSGEMSQHFSAYQHHLTREQYFQRVARKTGALFALATESGGFLGNAPELIVQGLRTYGYKLGTAFQIADDILDFSGDEQTLGKPVGNDLVQGTLTLPVIMLLERYPKEKSLHAFLEEGHEPQHMARVIEIIRDSSIISEAYQVAEGFCAEAVAALDPIADSTARRALLALTEYVLERKA